eukprot:139273_1
MGNSQKKITKKNDDISLIETDIEIITEKVNIEYKMRKYYIDNWYNSIKQFTFNTTFVSLDIETAKAMIRYHYQRYGNHMSNKNTSDKNERNETLESYNILIKLMNSNKDMKLLSNDIKLIKELHNKLKAKINECQTLWNNNKLFVRLSNRSSKDGSKIYKNDKENNFENVLQTIKQKYEFDEKENDIDLLNYQIMACMQCIYEDLWVDNSEDVISLFLSSDRIYNDLLNHLIVYYYQKRNDWNINIALREFNNKLCDELEFRCFVFKSEITAISQYNKYCFYKNLNEMKDEIEGIIINFWIKVDKFIELEDYVIDVALIEKECDVINDDIFDEKYECIVIEINPFDELTSGCLFDWAIHKRMLTNIMGDVTFKIHDDKNRFDQFAILGKKSFEELLSRYKSKFDEKNIQQLTQTVVIGSKFPVCTALRIAKWYNDRSKMEVARSDLFAKTAQEFVQMAIYYTNIITSDHLLTILLEVKSDIDNKSAFDMALEYGLTSFVANNRIETISTSIMNTYKFLKPCNIEDAFHIDALSVKLIWKHVQKPCFFFTPLGTYLSSAVSYLVFILIYTYLSSYQFDIHNTITTQELFFWILNIGYILHEMQMFVVDGLKLYFSQYSNFFDTLISCIFVSRLVIRLYSMFKSIDCKQNELCWSASNLNGIYVILWGISTILLWCGSINFFVLSPRLGPLIQMIYEMMDDIIAFFEIMIILASGFLVCLTFMFADIYAEFEGGIQSGVSLFRAILGDFNLDIFFGEENET